MRVETMFVLPNEFGPHHEGLQGLLSGVLLYEALSERVSGCSLLSCWAAQC